MCSFIFFETYRENEFENVFISVKEIAFEIDVEQVW